MNHLHMTSVGKGGARGPAKGLAPAHFFPLEGTVCFGHIITRKEHTNGSIEFIMNILIQFQTKYIIIPSFQTKTFIHLQG